MAEGREEIDFAVGLLASDVAETATPETETWLKFRDKTETETLS